MVELPAGSSEVQGSGGPTDRERGREEEEERGGGGNRGGERGRK